MPQMAPLSWLSLYFYFLMIYFIIIISNYYMFLYKPFIKKKSFKNKVNWMW